MYYSTIVILAILVLSIENYDIVLKRGENMKKPKWKMYRKFLISVLIYYVTDALWGFIEYLKLSALLYIDTLFYFIALAGGILFWTQFAVTYIDSKNKLGRLLVLTGHVFFAVFLGEVVINVFKPILFDVDSNCVYIAKPLRHIMLILQILLFSFVTIHAFIYMQRSKDRLKKRYQTIASFRLIVAFF